MFKIDRRVYDCGAQARPALSGVGGRGEKSSGDRTPRGCYEFKTARDPLVPKCAYSYCSCGFNPAVRVGFYSTGTAAHGRSENRPADKLNSRPPINMFRPDSSRPRFECLLENCFFSNTASRFPRRTFQQRRLRSKLTFFSIVSQYSRRKRHFSATFMLFYFFMFIYICIYKVEVRAKAVPCPVPPSCDGWWDIER